jgi:hypothetical protein
MNLPFEYDQLAVGEFGGTTPTTTDFANARVVILPVPLDRTTSYVSGTRNGPHEILVASSHMELWDEETQTDVHSIGIYTLPEMEFPFAGMDEVVCEIRRVASELVNRGKFPLVLGGEHSITPAVVGAVAAKHPGLSVLQIDAHADLRDSFMGTPHNHAGKDASDARFAPTTQVGFEPVTRKSRRRARSPDHDFRLQHARRSALDRSRRRVADRHGASPSTSTASIRRSCRLYAKPGGLSGMKRWPCCGRLSSAAPSSAATSWSCRRWSAISRQLSVREADLQDPVYRFGTS